MSEQKKHRPISEIQREFQNLCARAGHMQYQIVTLGKDLEVLNSTMRDLNLEAAASKAAESEQPKVEESSPVSEENPNA